MAVEIGGVTYYRVDRALVVDETGNPVENLTGGQVYADGGGSPLPLAEYPSQAPLASLTTGPQGLLGEFFVAFPDGAPPQGYIDWPDDVPPQAISATAAEVAVWLVNDLVGGVDLATLAGDVTDLKTWQTATEATVAALPTNYVQTINGRPMRHTYLDGTAGDPDADDLQPNDIVEVLG